MPKLTDRVVASLACPAGRKDAMFFDGTLKGFGVRVSKGGVRTFIFQYRVSKGVRRLPIGSFGAELTTSQARAKAEALRGNVRSGGDPVGARRKQRAADIEAEVQSKKRAAIKVFTLRALVTDWDEKHLALLRPSYRNDATGRINLHLADLLDRSAAEIERTEIVRELDRIAKVAGETTARRVLGYARSAYSWTQKRGAIAVNPFAGLPPIGRDVRRDRVLDASEIGSIWKAAGDLDPMHGAFVRFLMLTLCRRDEAAGLRWSELTDDLTTWVIPGARAKNGKAHVVHLAPAARALISGLPWVEGRTFVFTIRDDKPLSSFSYMVRKINEAEKLKGWHLHDFRRTGVTVLASKNFPPHVCDRLLNHVQGTIKGVAAIYQRHEFLKERKAALNAWASYIEACALGKKRDDTKATCKGAFL